jgi:translation elongation factor P/translation initiation factor 5A
LGVGDLASQCPNKTTMILHDNEEVEIENDDNYENISPFEDDSDDDVEYLVEGESLVVRRALSVQF